MYAKQKTAKKLSLLIAFSLLASLVTMFFGGPFLRVLRKSYGPGVYWVFFGVILTVSLVAKTYLLLFLIGSLWLAVGISVELENLKLPFNWNVMMSSLIGSLLTVLGYGYVLNQEGINSFERLKTYFSESLQKVMRSGAENPLDVEALMYQIPSIVMLLFIVSIVVSFLFERRVYFWLKLPKQIISYKISFLDYRVQETTVWLALISLLLSILDFKSYNLDNLQSAQIIGTNLVNIFVVVFFFQGFAVLEVFLKKTNASVFFRALTYFIFIGQLFLVLSFIGFIDFWIDFRTRMNKASWLKNESI